MALVDKELKACSANQKKTELCSYLTEMCRHEIGPDVRKPVFGVSHKFISKPACSGKEPS